MTRRDFFIGGAAFATLGAFGGNRFIPAVAGLKAGEKPRLRFGVLSDVHIMTAGKKGDTMTSGMNNLTFKHALEWFREQNVDAVVIAGDIVDKGMVEQMMAVADAWYSVFPGDRYPDGRPIEKVFVNGNHDWGGWRYGGYAAKHYPDKAERDRHILQSDMAKFWQDIFHEQYAPIYSKAIKGYTFVGSHWDSTGGGYEFARIKDWMAQNGKKLDPKLPFFYVQHPHLKNTCYGSWAWGRDKGIATKTLSAFPNAIAFSGHSHYSLTDERTVWQGAFTSVGTASLCYTAATYNEFPDTGFENSTGAKSWMYDAAKLSPVLRGGDCRQGMLWSVYDDCITVKRREFLSDLDLGPDWTMPLSVAESRPFAFAERAKVLRAPEFPAGAEISVVSTTAKNRGGKSKKGTGKVLPAAKKVFRVTVPAVVPDGKARLFSVEFTAEGSNGVKHRKTILAEGYNHSLKHGKAKLSQSCFFVKEDLGAGDVLFTVTPMNCFGARGKSLSAKFKA